MNILKEQFINEWVNINMAAVLSSRAEATNIDIVEGVLEALGVKEIDPIYLDNQEIEKIEAAFRRTAETIFTIAEE